MGPRGGGEPSWIPEKGRLEGAVGREQKPVSAGKDVGETDGRIPVWGRWSRVGPPPRFPIRARGRWGREETGGGGRGRAHTREILARFSVRVAGKKGEGLLYENPHPWGLLPPTLAVSRGERSHCPSQTVKKLLEAQRRRRQSGSNYQPQGQIPATSANETEPGLGPFSGEVQVAGLGGPSAPPAQAPGWDLEAHALYPDCHYHCAASAEAFYSPGIFPPTDPGGLASFPSLLEAPVDATGVYVEPTPPPGGPWGVPGPPQLLAAQGASLDAARAEVHSLGLQRLLTQDEEGDTLLHLFAAQGLRWSAYAVAEVLQGCGQLDIREHQGKTPLLVAATANQPLIVQDLLTLGADPNATDHRGRTILHLAATYGLPGVLTAVFNSGIQVDMETRDFEGLTPLHAAVLSLNEATQQPACGPRIMTALARDRLACVQMLIQMGADHTSQEFKSNKTILHLAVQGGNLSLVQMLLDLPNGDPRAFVNMKAHGNTALHMAAALPPGFPQEPIIRGLLAAGADPALRNLENEQPAHLLGPGPASEALRQLLKRSRTLPLASST
ncbi:NF-kappa-B inhibitor delta [Macrotis lagotis]|uniref:NF-kappa-B inhibitor delta n=1 Tax=Macrotis lagotis TaxID=92651 RepID=UPI003D69A944